MKQREIVPGGIYVGKTGDQRTVVGIISWRVTGNYADAARYEDRTGTYTIRLSSFARWAVSKIGQEG